MKKSRSTVPGDIPPKLLLRVADKLAKPLSSIFNAVLSTEWPALWRLEYQTIIPKKKNPSSLNDCRNLSCTNFFSKVLESFVLEGLRSEINLSDKQFGGLKAVVLTIFC